MSGEGENTVSAVADEASPVQGDSTPSDDKTLHTVKPAKAPKPVKLTAKDIRAMKKTTGGKVPNIPQPTAQTPEQLDAIRKHRAERAEREALASPALSQGRTGHVLKTSNIVLPNTALGFKFFYDLVHADRGFFLPPHLVHLGMALTDTRIPKLLVIVGPGSGKSVMLSTAFPAFMLGQDPTLTIVGISAGESLMQGFMSAVMEWIEYSPAWKFIFPEVVPDKGRGWSVDKGMFVKGRNAGDPDASYLAAGLTSKRLTGVHGRLIIGDDLHDKENSASAISCQGVIDSYYSQILGRADPRGARFVFAGRRWHEEDIYGHLKKTGEWVVMELPNVREKSPLELYWDVTVPEGLECCFSEMIRGEEPSNWGVPKSVAEALQSMQDPGITAAASARA